MFLPFFCKYTKSFPIRTTSPLYIKDEVTQSILSGKNYLYLTELFINEFVWYRNVPGNVERKFIVRRIYVSSRRYKSG